MGTAQIMFLWPYRKPKLDDKIIGDVIQAVEGKGEPTHVAIVQPGYLLEALWYGVTKSPRDKYKNRPYEIWEIEVPHHEFAPIAVQVLLGRRYSLLSCILGLLRRKFGIKIPYVNSSAADCSQAGTTFIAMQDLDLFGIDSPAGVIPSELRYAMRDNGGKKIESNF